MTASALSWVRYVRHHQVAEYEALGWVRTGHLGGCHHGEWSELMRFEGEDHPPEPQTQAGE